MKKKILKQPAVFKHMPDIFQYEAGYMPDGEQYVFMAYRDADWQRQIHLEVNRWSHNIAKQLKKDFAEVKSDAERAGLLEICITYPQDDVEKWKKFINFLGFPQPETFHMSIMVRKNG